MYVLVHVYVHVPVKESVHVCVCVCAHVLGGVGWQTGIEISVAVHCTQEIVITKNNCIKVQRRRRELW